MTQHPPRAATFSIEALRRKKLTASSQRLDGWFRLFAGLDNTTQCVRSHQEDAATAFPGIQVSGDIRSFSWVGFLVAAIMMGHHPRFTKFWIQAKAACAGGERNARTEAEKLLAPKPEEPTASLRQRGNNICMAQKGRKNDSTTFQPTSFFATILELSNCTLGVIKISFARRTFPCTLRVPFAHFVVPNVLAGRHQRFGYQKPSNQGNPRSHQIAQHQRRNLSFP